MSSPSICSAARGHRDTREDQGAGRPHNFVPRIHPGIVWVYPDSRRDYGPPQAVWFQTPDSRRVFLRRRGSVCESDRTLSPTPLRPTSIPSSSGEPSQLPGLHPTTRRPGPRFAAIARRDLRVRARRFPVLSHAVLSYLQFFVEWCLPFARTCAPVVRVRPARGLGFVCEVRRWRDVRLPP